MNKKFIARLIRRTSRFVDRILDFSTARNLSALFFLFSLLMVSISLVVGLNPHMRVYVLASPEATGKISEIAHGASPDIEILTPEQEFNEVATLVRLDSVYAIIIGDAPGSVNFPDLDFIREALPYSPYIVVLKDYVDYGLAREVKLSFQDRAILVETAKFGEQLCTLFQDYQGYRLSKSLFKWLPDYGTYVLAVRTVVASSLLLVFLQIGLISYIAVRARDINQLPKVILIAVATFLYAQITFTTCSTIIGMPLGLHASAPGVAAPSLLGPFREGASLRAVFSSAGFALGIGSALKHVGLKINKRDVVIGIIGAPIVAILGLLVLRYWAYVWFSIVYLFCSIPFGRSVMAAFMVSRGILNYFTGVLPLIILTKAEKVTRTLVFLTSALLIFTGSMRIGDLLPYQTYASVIPGILLGLGLTGLFMAMSYVEGVVGKLVFSYVRNAFNFKTRKCNSSK